MYVLPKELEHNQLTPIAAPKSYEVQLADCCPSISLKQCFGL